MSEEVDGIWFGPDAQAAPQLNHEVMSTLQTWPFVAIFESHFLPSVANHLLDSSCKKEGHGQES